MRFWSLQYDENNKLDFPQILYKGFVISHDVKFKALKQIFKIFYLTHRDCKKQIKEIESNSSTLPYYELYKMILPPKDVEFQKEYLVDLLNYFNLNIDDLLK